MSVAWVLRMSGQFSLKVMPSMRALAPRIVADILFLADWFLADFRGYIYFSRICADFREILLFLEIVNYALNGLVNFICIEVDENS